MHQQIAVISWPPFLCALAVLAALKVQPPCPHVSPISALIILADGLAHRHRPRRPLVSLSSYVSKADWESANSGEGHTWYSASRRQPIHAASHDLNCCLTLATRRYYHPPDCNTTYFPTRATDRR